MHPSILSSLKLAVMYAVFSAFWIIYSDRVVSELFTEPQAITQIQTYKGWFFITTTALLLFFLARRNYRGVERAYQLDGLTGLLSHNIFKVQLEQRLASLAPGRRVVLGYLDIDNFKELNRSIGFDRADMFIQQLAADIKQFTPSDALIARFPPDQLVVAREFAMDEDIDRHVRSCLGLCKITGQKMQVQVACSVGVAVWPQDGTTARQLMDAAASALAGAKRQRDTVLYHDRRLSEHAAKRRRMLVDLRAAISGEALSVVYQPKYAIETGIITGVEVLVRWQHAQDGAIPPDIFVPLAEVSGLSPELSDFVIRRVAAELSASGLLGTLIRHVAINISATEFNLPGQMDRVLDSIKRYPDLASCICIEITETATLHDMPQSAAIIARLRGEGFSFSIDDFGTGYTSLAMLKDFTIDEIKIDRSFISGIETEGRSMTIVNAIIAMAGSFGINVVAEGVETQAQLNELRAMGCKEAQGFLLAKPMDISALAEHLAAVTPDPTLRVQPAAGYL